MTKYVHLILIIVWYMLLNVTLILFHVSLFFSTIIIISIENKIFFSVISSSGLVQIQKDFTRNDKILDLLCTNKPDLFSDIRSIPGISDHEIILANCNLKPVVCKKPPRTIYLWNKVDLNKVCLLASEFSESFLPEHGTRSVDKNYTMFKEFIALTMKEHIPNKLTSTRTNLPWFNSRLKRMCKVKRRRFKRAKK